MDYCRVCRSQLSNPIYTSPSPGVTSVVQMMSVATTVYVCENCNHIQSADLEDVDYYYDSQYRISLQSEDHDQLISLTGGGTIYRTDLQTKVITAYIDTKRPIRLLDYGAAKAITLKKLIASCENIEGFAFDISRDYEYYWSNFLDKNHFAFYTTPEAWIYSFDYVVSSFVLEHVTQPVDWLRNVSRFLSSSGRLIILVPDASNNSGDVLAVDHLSHFTEASIRLAHHMAGLQIEHLDTASFPGAFLCVSHRLMSSDSEKRTSLVDFKSSHSLVETWMHRRARLLSSSALVGHRPVAIFGAGLYGLWTYSLIKHKSNVEHFIDSNRHIQGTEIDGVPVFGPDFLSERLEAIYVALNPSRARFIVKEIPQLVDHSARLIFLD